MLHLNVKTEFSFEEQEDLVHLQVQQENLYAVMETEVFCKKKTFFKKLFIHAETGGFRPSDWTEATPNLFINN